MDQTHQVFRERCGDFEWLSGARVGEGDRAGVEGLAFQDGLAWPIGGWGSRDGGSAAIQTVAENGSAGVRQVDSDLMRPSGLRLCVQQRDAAVSLGDFEKCYGGSGGGVVFADRHLFPLVGMRTDRAIDQVAIAIGRWGDRCPVVLLDRPMFELLGELRVCEVVLGDQYDAAGIAIQSVDDARSVPAAGGAELLEVVGQRGGQGSSPMTFGGVHHHPSGLVDCDEVIVFVQDAQRDRLGDEVVRRFGDDPRGDEMSEFEFERRSGWGIVDLDCAGDDLFLDLRSAQ